MTSRTTTVLASLARLRAWDVSHRRSRQLRRRCHAMLQAEPPVKRLSWMVDEARSDGSSSRRSAARGVSRTLSRSSAAPRRFTATWHHVDDAASFTCTRDVSTGDELRVNFWRSGARGDLGRTIQDEETHGRTHHPLARWRARLAPRRSAPTVLAASRSELSRSALSRSGRSPLAA